MSDLLERARHESARPSVNCSGWYSCTCGDLIAELCDEIERLQSFVEQQLCDCLDEYGNPRPQPCDRCQLLGQREGEPNADRSTT
jgi:hypothetical protein